MKNLIMTVVFFDFVQIVYFSEIAVASVGSAVQLQERTWIQLRVYTVLHISIY